jgi:hypothetical protein
MSSDHRREIECLVCGTLRLVEVRHTGDTGECVRCGYVGWRDPESAGHGSTLPIERRLFNEAPRMLASTVLAGRGHTTARHPGHQRRGIRLRGRRG